MYACDVNNTVDVSFGNQIPDWIKTLMETNKLRYGEYSFPPNGDQSRQENTKINLCFSKSDNYKSITFGKL